LHSLVSTLIVPSPLIQAGWIDEVRRAGTGIDIKIEVTTSKAKRVLAEETLQSAFF
jgi:hypothetical protein